MFTIRTWRNLVVYRVCCAKGVGATSSESFLVSQTADAVNINIGYIGLTIAFRPCPISLKSSYGLKYNRPILLCRSEISLLSVCNWNLTKNNNKQEMHSESTNLRRSELDWIEQGLTSHQTHYRSYQGRVLWVKWPNQQCQSTEGR